MTKKLSIRNIIRAAFTIISAMLLSTIISTKVSAFSSVPPPSCSEDSVKLNSLFLKKPIGIGGPQYSNSGMTFWGVNGLGDVSTDGPVFNVVTQKVGNVTKVFDPQPQLTEGENGFIVTVQSNPDGTFTATCTNIVGASIYDDFSTPSQPSNIYSNTQVY